MSSPIILASELRTGTVTTRGKVNAAWPHPDPRFVMIIWSGDLAPVRVRADAVYYLPRHGWIS